MKYPGQVPGELLKGEEGIVAVAKGNAVADKNVVADGRCERALLYN
jgi:hypothetical protein